MNTFAPVLAFVLAFGPVEWSRAASFNVTGDAADYELQETQTIGNTTGAALRVGATSATTPGGRNAFFIFALPVIGSTSQVSTATLDFNYASKSGSPAFNADLWGIGFYPDTSGITNKYLEANSDPDPENVKLQVQLLTSSSSTGAATSSNFAAYVQSFYATNSGYGGGSYVFLRVNPDADAGNAIVGYNLSSANSTSPPVLTISTTGPAVPAPPTDLIADAGNLQVALSWTAASGATNYLVKRATTSGGPYTVTNPVAATNYTDTGLTNFTIYYYVVSAVTTNGESANCGEVRALPVALAPFVHPGLLHDQADLDRMKSMVASHVEPWYSGFIKLQSNSLSQANYTIRWQPTTNFYTIGRNPDVNKTQVESDCSAAYQLALMWYITGNQAYADKAIQILNDWSSSLTNISGADAILAASLDGDKFVNAAEILRYTGAGWADSDIARFAAMLTNVFYPVIRNFATFANGNWDTGCIKTMMGIGVFTDNADLFERAVDYFYNVYEGGQAYNGAVNHYLMDTGECQESGRDQQHAQLGIGHLAEAGEIGYHQGLDLYGAYSNRLLAGFEYAAKYNLGYDVPYVEFKDYTGKYDNKTISPAGRGRFRPIFEMVYNHYANRRGLAAPFTGRVATNVLDPEGAFLYADHPGFGTLLFSLQSRAAPPRTEAESYSGQSGVSVESCTEGGQDMKDFANNDYVRFAGVDFTGIRSFSGRVASATTNGNIKIMVDSSTTGTVLGICAVPVTGGAQFWSTVSCNLAPTNGTHDLFLVASSDTTSNLFSLNWFNLSRTNAFPQAGVNIIAAATGTLTPVDVGGQPAGTNLFGGEAVGNNAPASYPVGTNLVIWASTNLSGNVVTVTQTVVVLPSPGVPSGLTAVPGDGQAVLTWAAATDAAGYNVKQSTTNGGPYTTIASGVATTNCTAASLINGTMYYYVVSATNSAGESGNSDQAGVLPTSRSPPLLAFQIVAGQVQFTWPADHKSWRLLAQTNPPNAGLGTNWVTVSGSAATNRLFIPLDAANSSVFYRLIYP